MAPRRSPDRVGGTPNQLLSRDNHPRASLYRSFLVQARRHIGDHAFRDPLRGRAI
jgi:hypothetical protein